MPRRGGRLAQLVERLVYTEDVGSSSLSPPTSRRSRPPPVSMNGFGVTKPLGQWCLAAVRQPGCPCRSSSSCTRDFRRPPPLPRSAPRGFIVRRKTSPSRRTASAVARPLRCVELRGCRAAAARSAVPAQRPLRGFQQRHDALTERVDRLVDRDGCHRSQPFAAGGVFRQAGSPKTCWSSASAAGAANPVGESTGMAK